jgi:signal transduction histidine kinase
VSVRLRALGAFVLLLVLFLALVFVQVAVGDRLQDERTARADLITRTQEANRAVLQFMTDTETGVRGFQLTGSRKFLEPYESGRAGALGALSAVEEDHDSEVQRLVGEERQAVSRWLYAYAIPIVNAGTADADEERAERGKDMFDRIRTANSAVDAAVVTEQETTAAAGRRPERTTQLLFATLAVLILVTGLGVAVLHQRHLLHLLERLRRTLRHAVAAEMRTDRDRQETAESPAERLRLRQLRLINELRILDEQKDVFVSTVTHELRTPLTNILGYTEMLADDDLTPAQARGVDVILRNANRLQATVADLILLDRGTDRTGSEAVPVDVAALAGGLHADLGPAARAKDLSSTLQAEPAWVRGDAAHLQRALRNLMENAIKFTPAGGRVGCTIAAFDEHVVVTVTDTGIGIPADDVPGLFTPFHRAANAMHLAVQGNGLGLAIVRTIVTEHGGSVTARSELGRGSSFTVTLPAALAR